MKETIGRTNGRWLLLGCVLALAGCAGESDGPLPAVSPPTSSEPGTNGLVTQIRPQVARVGDDPLLVVLHWEGKNGPLQYKDRITTHLVDLCDSLTFNVTTPDGKKLTLRPEPQAKKGGNHALGTSTVFLSLTSSGLEVTYPPALEASWKDGPVPELDAAGTFEVSVSGRVASGEAERDRANEPAAFASPAVKLERGVGGHEPLGVIIATARGKVGRKATAAAPVYDDTDGNRLVRLTGPSNKQWHSAVFHVHVSPAGKVLNVFRSEQSDCLAEGTPLDGEAGTVAIEDVRVGDRLWGFDLDSRERILTTVRGVRRAEADETLRLECGLRVTGGHPVLASGAWKRAADLRPADELTESDGRRVPVGAVERLRERVAVYDLTVDEPHNFFAAGVLVHNKERPPMSEHDDLWYVLWPRQAR